MFEFLNSAGEKVIEETFMAQLDGLDANDLKTATNENINLLEQTMKCRPHILRMARRLAMQFAGQRDYLTLDNLMIWLKNKRPDLYFSILVDSTGKQKKWLKTQLEQFKQYLFS